MTSIQSRIGRLRPAGSFRLRRVDYAAGLRQPSHDHDFSSVTLVLAGEVRETSRWGEETGGALSLTVKPAGVSHSDEIGPRGARTFQCVLPTAALAHFCDAGAPLDRWRWYHGTADVSPFLLLARMLGKNEPAGTDLEDLVVEALAGLGTTSEPLLPAPGWLERVREAVDDDILGDRTSADLARVAGVHPASLSRAFRRSYGLTLTAYRRRVRLRRAAALVGDTPMQLSRIAHASGYADHPHLCRDFRDLTALTPSAFRRLIRRP